MLSSNIMMSAEDLAKALGGRRDGAQFIACCPAHDDKNPSLSLSDGESGLLWHCFGGCSQNAVADALRERRLLPSPSSTIGTSSSRSGFANPDELADWLARKSDATVTRIDLYSPTFAEIRLDGPNGKIYRPIHRISGRGWKTGDPPGKLPLYKIDQLPSDLEVPILVVEGPKCADAARKLGFHATTSPHGAQSARKADWSPLKDRLEILIWPDNDPPGQKYASAVREILIHLGVPRQGIRILDPGKMEMELGEDIVDWIDRHPGETPDLSGLSVRANEPKQSDPEWTSQLDRTPTGRLIANSRTLGLILRRDPNFQGLRFNTFRFCPFFDDDPITKSIIFKFAEKIESTYGRGSTVPLAGLRDAVEAVATERTYHPIRDWLDSLVWDGIPRIDKLFPVYFGAEDTPYTRAIGKNSLIAAVVRIDKPGSKVDTMPIIESPQGAKKSSGIAALFGEGATAVLTALPGTKDFAAGLQGKWCLEIAEMDSFRDVEVSRVKATLSMTSDWVRLSYRPDFQDLPRQCVFWGTVNEFEYLKDATGARRFWPVTCGTINLEGIRQDRDQLWAEAVARYRNGETWWEAPEEETKGEQEARYQADAWEDPVGDWLTGQSEVTTSQIMTECLGIELARQDRSAQTRVGNILRRLGWSRKKIRIGNNFRWIYRPPEIVPTSDVGTGENKVGTTNTGELCSYVPTQNHEKTFLEISPSLSQNSFSLEQGGNGENNPVMEPCSHLPNLFPPSAEVGTNKWKGIE